MKNSEKNMETIVALAKGRGFADSDYNLKYSNSWSDIALGKQMSESMIDTGADVMFSYANELSLGVINGAVAKGALPSDSRSHEESATILYPIVYSP